MIFQDPFSSLNPRKRVIDIITEAPLYHKLITKSEKRAFAAEMLQRVGLDPDTLERYPHQFSGGQRQRVGIARALAVSPEFLVCDESIAALDVSIQAQIINLFVELKDKYDLTYLFISHDIGVIEHISDRVIVMYLGRIVETAPIKTFVKQPNHPYTQALLEGCRALKLASGSMSRSVERFHHPYHHQRAAIFTHVVNPQQRDVREKTCITGNCPGTFFCMSFE